MHLTQILFLKSRRIGKSTENETVGGEFSFVRFDAKIVPGNRISRSTFSYFVVRSNPLKYRRVITIPLRYSSIQRPCSISFINFRSPGFRETVLKFVLPTYQRQVTLLAYQEREMVIV